MKTNLSSEEVSVHEEHNMKKGQSEVEETETDKRELQRRKEKL
jgi:hypothetical protein